MSKLFVPSNIDAGMRGLNHSCVQCPINELGVWAKTDSLGEIRRLPSEKREF